jgi:hypothetical protein
MSLARTSWYLGSFDVLLRQTLCLAAGRWNPQNHVAIDMLAMHPPTTSISYTVRHSTTATHYNITASKPPVGTSSSTRPLSSRRKRTAIQPQSRHDPRQHHLDSFKSHLGETASQPRPTRPSQQTKCYANLACITTTMSQGQQTSPNQVASTKSSSSVAGAGSPEAGPDDWSDVKDPSERRKIQNKLAQRRFRKYYPVRQTVGVKLTCKKKATRSRNRRRRRSEIWRTNGELEAHMQRPSQRISIQVKRCLDYRGVASR